MSQFTANLPQSPNLRMFLALGGAILGLLLCMVCGIAVVPRGDTTPTPQVAQNGTDTPTPTGTVTATGTLSATFTPTPSATYTPLGPTPQCPEATAEPLWVDPVNSPTDQLVQIVNVYIGGGEFVQINSEAGTFTASGNFSAFGGPAQVKVQLVPNSANHLQVMARVRTVNQGGCTYGGYTLHTTLDRNGGPLVIVHKLNVPPTWTPTRTPYFTPTPTATKPGVALPGAHPNGIAEDTQRGQLWVSGRDSNSVYVIDEKTLRLVDTVPVGKSPLGVLYFNDQVYVANFGSDSITILNAATHQDTNWNPNSFTRIRLTFGEPTFFATATGVGRAGRVFVPLHSSGRVLAIDPATGAANYWSTLSTNPTPAAGGGPYGIASTSPNLDRIYVSRRDANDLVVLDVVEPLVSSIFPLRASPYFVAANPYTLSNTYTYRVYVTLAPLNRPNAPDSLTYVDAAYNSDLGVPNNPALTRGATVNVGSLGGAGGYIAIYPRVGSVWDDSVWVSTDTQVIVYNRDLTQRLRIYGAQDGLQDPYGIVLNPGMKRAYVTDGAGDRVVPLTIP